MNRLINVIINKEHKEGFDNLHINEINNIPDYSVDILKFNEINILPYESCNQAISILLQKLRPKTGVLMLDTLDSASIFLSYLNKMLSSSEMSIILSGLKNTFNTEDIVSLISNEYSGKFAVLKIDNNKENSIKTITIQRNGL